MSRLPAVTTDRRARRSGWSRFDLRLIACLILLPLTAVACERPDPEVTIVAPVVSPATLSSEEGESADISQLGPLPPTPIIFPTSSPFPEYHDTPTPDPTRSVLVSEEGDYLYHSVAPGETLTYIAEIYGSTVEELMSINDMEDGDFLSVDQVLFVPADAQLVSPSFKLIPDSELIYGPAAKDFDVRATATTFGGYLLSYREEVEGQMLDGPEIVQLVADRHGVNPRLLLALLEFRAGWLTKATMTEDEYPMGYVKTGQEGLYAQLRWAANLANLGFYGRSEGGLHFFDVGDAARVAFAPDINDGTAGLQLLFATTPSTDFDHWQHEIGPDGFYATFSALFGNPFAYTVDPLLPAELQQPPLQLPWPEGETWYFTGGPHGAWASGSAWAALDFAPGVEQVPCQSSDRWITSMSDGMVTRSEFGAVVVDLDGDGYAGSGWSISYQHVASEGRISAGTEVQVGDRLGHPSCEGGFADSTHVHVARSYNGRWISADSELPLVLSGWVSKGLGREYDGLLIREDVVKEACNCAEEGNAITAD